MQRKITWLILFSVLGLAIIIFGGNYYLRSSDNSANPNNQQQGEKDFLDFLAQKKKLSQANEEVSLVANSRIVYFWDSDNNAFQKASEATIYLEIPKNNAVVSREEQADLDNNAIKETYALENGRLTISENSKIIWESPADWWIDNFVIADSNNDGIIDINLSLWKAGSFGPSKPFWIKENDMSVKNHFFIYDLADGAIKQIWGSSNLGTPNCEFNITDIDNDGKNDLVAIEGDYSRKPEYNGNYVAVWKWNGWGFSNEWRSEKGNFSNLEIEKIDGKSYIMIDSF